MLTLPASLRWFAVRLLGFAAPCLMTLPLHAGAIATAEAYLDGPGYLQSCDQTSDGPELQCSFQASGNGSSVEASASFGDLLAQADVGADEPWSAKAEATASFSSNVIFSQTGTIIGTWVVSWGQGGGVYIPDLPGLLAIMGTTVSFEGGPNPFFVSVPFTDSGGPIAVSASDDVVAESPDSQGFFITLQLIGFSSDYTILPDAPEPGTGFLVALGLLALGLVRAPHRAARR